MCGVALTLAMAVLVGSPRSDARQWRTGDTLLEVAYVSVQSVDWMQTRHFLAEGREELNPILGARPSRGKLAAYQLTTLSLHAAIAYVLPRPYRTLWQCAWIGIEVWMVVYNVRTHGALHIQLP